MLRWLQYCWGGRRSEEVGERKKLKERCVSEGRTWVWGKKGWGSGVLREGHSCLFTLEKFASVEVGSI